jgi:predicted O-linked N-acetylglucosamine transferase (SPINDLY family)
MHPANPVTVALQFHRAGDLDHAEALYRRLLQADPTNPEAWHLLGVLATQRGHPRQALEYIGKALRLRPDAAFYLNLGVAYQALGQRSDALASFQEAVRLQPDFPEAQNNLGNVLHENGRTDEAVAHWQRALALRPDYPEPHLNLCQALREQGQHGQAVEHGREAVRLRPQSAAGHFNLGQALAEQKDFAEAEACFRRALELQPRWGEAHAHLGLALAKQDRRAEAVANLEQAVQYNPDYPDASNALGMVLAELGRPEEAIVHFERAIWLRPDYADAHNNWGQVLRERRQFGPAVEHFRQALRLQPDLVEAHRNLGHTLMRLGRLDEALASYREALQRRPHEAQGYVHVGDALAQQGRLDEAKATFEEALRLDPSAAGAHACLLNALAHDPGVAPADLLAEHRRWAEVHARVPLLGPPPDHDRQPDRRLRVGYLSADFQGHVVARFIEPVLAHHLPAAVETICYADLAASDGTTERLRQLAHRWVPISGLSDAQVAETVRNDRVDILVDLGGHTGARLGVFARRPAPIQVTWLGYPATTGLETIDYRLTDGVADPEGEPEGHTEQLVRLACGFCCWNPPPEAPPVSELPALVKGHMTFGSLHKLTKLNHRVLDLWSRVLHAIPTARLLVFRDTLHGSPREALRQRFADRGLAEDRVLLRHTVAPGTSFLDVYGEIDLALDAFPWVGHATACEGLWMGVPVLTLRGDRHAGRMVASVLTRIGLADLITDSPEAFVTQAVAWASDLDRLAGLRRELRDQVRGTLCDGATFTRCLEEAYRWMWHRWVTAKCSE